MKIDKLANTFNYYKLEVSFGELTAMLNALESAKDVGPVADEMRAAIAWYVERIPGPGEDKDEFKAKKDAEKQMAKTAMEPPAKDGASTEGPAGEDADKELPEPPKE